MKDIENCLKKQLEVSKELHTILTKVDLIEKKEREILYKENERLLKELDNINEYNIDKTNDRVIKLRKRVNNLLNQESTNKDPNFKKYLINFDNELQLLTNKISYLENNLSEMNNKHNNYVDNNIKEKSTKQVNISNIPTNIKNHYKSSKINYNEKLEFKLGSNVLNIIGVVLILIALITFGKYIYTNYMTNTLKGISLFVISSIVLLLGETVFKEKVTQFAIGISSLGVGGLYASLIINYLVLETINSIIAIILTLIITSISLFISSKNNSNIIRIISLIGGYGCLFPMDYLSLGKSYITVTMLLIISIANIYVPLKNNKFSIYSSILNIVFCIGIVNTHFLEDISIIIYLSITLILNNFMYIKLSDNNDNKHILSAILTSLSLILFSNVENKFIIGVIFLLISISSYLMAKNKLRNIYQIHMVVIIISLISIYKIELGIFYTILYCLLMSLNILLSMKEKDKYLTIFSTVLIVYGLIQFIVLESILTTIIYIITFSIIIWLLCDEYKDKKSVIVFKNTFFCSLIYATLVSGVFDYDFYKTLYFVVILSIIYILKINNIERLKHSTVKNTNKVILICSFFACNLFGFTDIINCILLFSIGSGVLLLLTNNKYVENKFISKHKLLIYSLYLSYGVVILFKSSSLVYEISNIATSIALMIIAFGNVWLGFKIDNLEIRKYGLILSLIVCAKLILVDFYLFDFVIKALLFLIIGVVALIISYIYSKLEQELKSKHEKDKYL